VVQPRDYNSVVVVGQSHALLPSNPMLQGGLALSSSNNMEIEPSWQVKSNKRKEVSSPSHVGRSKGEYAPKLWVKSYKDAMVHSLDHLLPGFETDNKFGNLGLHLPLE
jgi:hypothetical protein